MKARLPLVHQLQRVALANVMKAVLAFRVEWALQAATVRNSQPNRSRFLTDGREQVWLAR